MLLSPLLLAVLRLLKQRALINPRSIHSNREAHLSMLEGNFRDVTTCLQHLLKATIIP